MSGSPSAMTGLATRSSTPTTTSSIAPVRPGTASSSDPGRSCFSANKIELSVMIIQMGTRLAVGLGGTKDYGLNATSVGG